MSVLFFFQRRPIYQVIRSEEKKNIDFYHSPLVLVNVVHLAFMTLFGFTSMHVQVSVNFLLIGFYVVLKKKMSKQKVKIIEK